MKDQNNSCVCPECGWILPEGRRHRNHCPNCLAGVHMEDSEGYDCGGILEPIGVWVREDWSWEILQRCRTCGEILSAPLTDDDSRIKILSIASKPLSSPPFPVERLEELTKIMGGSGHTGGKNI